MKKIFAVTLLVVSIFAVNTLYSQAASGDLSEQLKGRILLQVEEHGEAWYIHPDEGLRYYMRDGAVAYEMMRSFGLGITDSDLM